MKWPVSTANCMAKWVILFSSIPHTKIVAASLHTAWRVAPRGATRFALHTYEVGPPGRFPAFLSAFQTSLFSHDISYVTMRHRQEERQHKVPDGNQ